MASLIPLGVGVGAKLLGGLFGMRGKKKKEQAARKAAIGQAELKNQMGEDKRLAGVSAGQSLLGQLTGKGFTNIDPATAAKLATRRTYDFSKGVPEAGAGAGSDLLAGLFGSVGDIADQYGANQGDMGAPMSAAPSAIPTQELVPFDPKLGQGGFGSGTLDFG
jgi:hypothetical protein